METAIIRLQNQEFVYQIQYKNTRILKMRFKNGIISIVAPYATSQQKIIDFITRHQRYVFIRYARYLNNKAKEIINENDKITLLNETYTLRFHDTASCVQFDTIYIQNSKKDNFKNEIIQLFSKSFSQYMISLTKKYYRIMKIKVDFPSIIFKRLKSKWGSYSKSKNQIFYNYELLFKSLPVCDYLVIHELAHMIEYNHSANFYKIVETYCPDYKTLQKKLKE